MEISYARAAVKVIHSLDRPTKQRINRRNSGLRKRWRDCPKATLCRCPGVRACTVSVWEIGASCSRIRMKTRF